ncbi:hypothetical protein A2U01_0111051 [Trifolium medium]|uniref:Uncharacterized protein n=1 Tax=Trifolium medium TaxID=97028 RepID=A0A392VQM9_9FABA|nr:hypothetical protein [Trifolium medium]
MVEDAIDIPVMEAEPVPPIELEITAGPVDPAFALALASLVDACV